MCMIQARILTRYGYNMSKSHFIKYIKAKHVEVNTCFNVRGGIAISATWSSEA